MKTVTIIWGALTVIGVIFGISTFFWNSSDRSFSSSSRKPFASDQAKWQTGDRPMPGPARTSPYIPPMKEDYYRKLLAKVRYDQALADRLIDYERKRMPLASLDELCRSAIERLERDNR